MKCERHKKNKRYRERGWKTGRIQRDSKKTIEVQGRDRRGKDRERERKGKDREPQRVIHQGREGR